MNRKFRLTGSAPIKRVRRFGKSYAHPLVVLLVMPGEPDQTRCGFIAGRSVGSAVQRNRAKRLLREAMRSLLENLTPGFHLLLIARKGAAQASWNEIQTALRYLLGRAQLLKGAHED